MLTNYADKSERSIKFDLIRDAKCDMRMREAPNFVRPYNTAENLNRTSNTFLGGYPVTVGIPRDKPLCPTWQLGDSNRYKKVLDHSSIFFILSFLPNLKPTLLRNL